VLSFRIEETLIPHSVQDSFTLEVVQQTRFLYESRQKAFCGVRVSASCLVDVPPENKCRLIAIDRKH
jgi:hypothetical protein